jgi:hypothetical protein
MIRHQEAAPEARKRSEEHCHGSMAHEELDVGGKAQLESSAPTAVASAILDVERHAAQIRNSSGEQRARMMVGLQQTYGNACVQRVVQRLSEEKEAPLSNPQGQLEKGAELNTLGNEPPRLGKRSPEVPDLDQGTVNIVKGCIKEGSKKAKQAAIVMILRSDEKRNTMPALYQTSYPVEGSTMFYDEDLPHDHDGLFKATPKKDKEDEYVARVSIGDPAFKSVPWLYSTIMHEYFHLERWQRSPWAYHESGEGYQEFLAYASDIRNAGKTGTKKSKRLIRDLGARMEWEGFREMTKKQQHRKKDERDALIKIIANAIDDEDYEPPSKGNFERGFS